MRWNCALKNDYDLRNNYSIDKFSNSQRQIPINTNINNELNLKSIQKVKQEGPTTKANQMKSTASRNPSQNNSKSRMNTQFSRNTELDHIHSTSSNDFFLNEVRFNEIDQVGKIVDQFFQQFNVLLNNYIQRFEKLIQNKEMRAQLNKKIVKQINQIVNRKMHIGEQILTNLNFNSESKETSKADSKDQQNKNDKKKLRVVTFKNDKVNQKNSFANIEKSFEQINKVIEVRKPKFVRNAQTKRIDKSSDSSVDEIMEKSNYEILRGNNSKMKVKQTLKKVNKILYQ